MGARQSDSEAAYDGVVSADAATAHETTSPGGIGESSADMGGEDLARGTMWQMAAQVVPLVINLTYTPYFIEELGKGRYGIFNVASILTMMLGQFDGGLGAAAMRFFSLYAGRNDRISATRMMTTVAAIFAAGTAVLFTIFFLLVPAILDFFKVVDEFRGESGFLLRVLVVLVAFLMVRNLYNSLLFSYGRFRITSIGIIASYFVYLAGLMLTLHENWGLYGVACTFVAQQIIGTLITVPAGMRYVDRRGLRWMDRAEAKDFFSYAWRVQLTGLIQMAVVQKDVLVKGRVDSAQSAGAFGQGSNFAANLRMLPWNAFGPFQARVGQTYGGEGADRAKEVAEGLQRVWVRGLMGYAAVGIPATYFGVGTWLRDSFGFEAAEVATILFVGSMAALLPSVLVIWCLTLGEPGIELRYAAIGLAVNVVASLIGWQFFGLLGVVAGTAVGQIVASLWLSWAARRLPVTIEWFGRSIPWHWMAMAGAVTFALEYFLHGFFPSKSPGLLLCGLLAVPGLAAYIVAVFGTQGLRVIAARIPGLKRFA